MALTITKAPSQVIPAKNQCDIEVSTNAYVTAAGIAATAIIQLSSTPTTGNLVIGNSVKSQTFTFETTPNTSGIQLPRNTGSLASDVFAETILIPALLNNYYLNRDYTIELNSFAPSTLMLLFTAKKKGAQYTISSSGTVTDYASISNTPGTDRAVQPNFRIFMDVFAEQTPFQNDFDLVFPAEGIPDENNKTGFNLQQVLEAITGYSIPPFTGAPIFVQDQVKRFYIKFCEVFGANPAPQRYYRWPTSESQYATALHAAARNSKYPFTTFGNPYYKTTMPSGAMVLHKQQKQFLTVYRNLFADDYYVDVKLYYSDGTSSSIIQLFYDSDVIGLTNRYVTFRCGYSDLDIDAIKASGKTVVKYDVRISGSTIDPQPEFFTFLVDNSIQRYPRYFLFINSYGFPETIYFQGFESRALELDTTIVQRPFVAVETANATIHGEFDETNKTLRGTSELSTGNRDKLYLEYFKDFLASPARYQQTATQFVKAIMEKATIEMDKDDDTLFALKIKLKDAMFERGNA